ncbi:hypothetical protein BV898_11097 [Hypsibius exemplaris]|uniref:Integrase zinc-binding domain-containing protein n=1 Tax=Hypsibius exemplaris TaxID=2072580 RepID=A0A1W0WHP6_HYPEX|nr:hypothetical protein BV898_11097 [Hypsibius exemplaris]
MYPVENETVGMLWSMVFGDTPSVETAELLEEQRKEPWISQVICEIGNGNKQTKKIFMVLDGLLYRIWTLKKVKTRVFWPELILHVMRYVASCRACEIRNISTTQLAGPFQSFCSTYPFEMVATDVVGPLPRSSRGNTFRQRLDNGVVQATQCATTQNVRIPFVRDNEAQMTDLHAEAAARTEVSHNAMYARDTRPGIQYNAGDFFLVFNPFGNKGKPPSF